MRNKAYGEYVKIQMYYSELRRTSEGTIIKRHEVFDLYLAVSAPTLYSLVESNLELDFYLRQCLNRNLSFDDFWTIVVSHKRRAA